MSPGPDLRVHGGAEDLAAAVAADVRAALVGIQAEGRVPRVVLTGGSMAEAVHRLLAEPVPGSEVPVPDWSRVEFFWGDERFLSAKDGDRNAVQARQALLDHVGVDPARVHEVGSSEAYASPDEAATAYREVLAAHAPDGFDLVMLSLGPDGHIASLFPGFPQLDESALDAVGVTGSPKPPPERVTLTYPALRRTRAVWFMVSGESKAEVLARALGGAEASEIPGAGMIGAPGVVWYVDTEAARDLAID